MITHALQLVQKDIPIILVSQEADQNKAGVFLCRVWSVTLSRLYQLGQIGRALYNYDTDEEVSEKGDRTFESINWAEFQKRFLDPQK